MLIAIGTPETQECCQFWVRNPIEEAFIHESIKALNNFHKKATKTVGKRLFIWLWSYNRFHVHVDINNKFITQNHVIPAKLSDENEYEYNAKCQEWLEKHSSDVIEFYNSFNEDIRKSDTFYENFIINYSKKTFNKVPFFHKGQFKIKNKNQFIIIENDESVVYGKSLAGYPNSDTTINNKEYINYKIYLHQKSADELVELDTGFSN